MQPNITEQYLESQGFSATFPKRFFAKIQKTETCWLWTGCLFKGGYGSIQKGARNSGLIGAHRASWILHCGPIPNNLCVLHNCPKADCPQCVNPEHLWLGNRPDNNADMRDKGMSIFGERNPRHKLSVEQIRDIREQYANGLTQYVLSKSFGVGQDEISRIVNFKRWNHPMLPPAIIQPPQSS